MTTKELKELYNRLTYMELKEVYDKHINGMEQAKAAISKAAASIAALDFENPRYASLVKGFNDSIKCNLSCIKVSEKDLKVLEPILKAKKEELQNDAAMEEYVDANKEALKPIYEAADAKCEEFIAAGCKVLVKGKEAAISEDEARKMHEELRNELLWIVKSKISKVDEVSELRYNGSRGFDCLVKGDGVTVEIKTIMAYGEVQRLHYRTLVHVK